MEEPTQRCYVTVSRGPAAATFREGDEWTVRAFPAGPSRDDMTFRTAYVSYGFEAKSPRWLYAEVSGSAESLGDAIRRFLNAVRSLTPIFDVALNASVADLDLHLGFESTSGCEEREFFQNFLREDPPTPRQVRQVRTGLLSCLTEAIARHPRPRPAPSSHSALSASATVLGSRRRNPRSRPALDGLRSPDSSCEAPRVRSDRHRDVIRTGRRTSHKEERT